MLLFTVVAACFLVTALLVLNANLWWFVAIMVAGLFALFGLELDRSWESFFLSFGLFTGMLMLFHQNDPTQPVGNSRFVETHVRRTQVFFRYFSAGYLVVFGLGFALFQSHLYRDVPGAFLAEVGVAQTLFKVYMGLLGIVLLVRTWRQRRRPPPSVQHLEA